MKHINILIMLVALFALSACVNKGIETGTPKPIQSLSTTLEGADGSDYNLTVEEGGAATVDLLDESGNVVGTANIQITPDENGDFEATAEFEDGTKLTLKGHIDEDGFIVESGIMIVRGTNGLTESSNGTSEPTVEETDDPSLSHIQKPSWADDYAVPLKTETKRLVKQRLCVPTVAGTLICSEAR